MTQKLVNASINGTWQNLREKWEKDPMMVFSVIGESGGMVPKTWNTAKLQDALIDAAKNAGESWIICGRGDNVISKLVADGFRQYQRREFIQIQPDEETGFKYNKMHNTKSPIDPCLHLITIGHDNDYLSEIHDDPTGVASYPFPEDIAEIGCKLSYIEIFWFDLESFFWKQRLKMDFDMRLPSIVLVAEGDFKTIDHVVKLVKVGIPVIIMKGSGRAADLIDAYLNDEDGGADDTKKMEKSSIPDIATSLFGVVYPVEKFKPLADIKKHRKFVRIFDLDNDDPLMLSRMAGEVIVAAWSTNDDRHNKTKDAIVSKMVTRKQPEHPVEQRPYVMKSSKFTSPESLPLFFYVGFQLIQEDQLIGEDQQILLMESLKWNRLDYVEVLLDQGIMLDMKHILTLYKTTVACSNCEFDSECRHMQWILRRRNRLATKVIFGIWFEEEALREQEKESKAPPKKTPYNPKELLKKVKKEQEREKEASKKVVYNAIQLCHDFLGYTDVFTDDVKEPSTANELLKARMTDLMLWSVFANRPELTTMMWKKCENHLLNSLVISALLRTLENEATKVKEDVLATSLKEHKEIFEQRSVAMLDHMYKLDPASGIAAVGDATSTWSIETSPLHFAYEHKMYDITSHKCAQKHVDRRWYNNLPPNPSIFVEFCCTNKKQFVSAPMLKFIINYIFFTLMLGCYSAYVLTSIDVVNYSNYGFIYEYYAYVWAFGDLVEDLRGAYGALTGRGKKSHRSFKHKAKRYINNFWNIIDVLSYLLLVASLLVRHLLDSNPYNIARRTFSISLLFLFIRYLQVFMVSRRMGPMLIQMKEMLKRLLKFLLLAVIVILGVGVYYHANLYPNHMQMFGDINYWQKWSVWKILYYPYWQLYQEINLDYLEVDDPHAQSCSYDTSVWQSNSTVERCPEADPSVPIVAGIYMLVSNLLLVNLIIAMFSNTYRAVLEKSERSWLFLRYALLLEYEEKIPSPWNLIFYPFRLMRRCCRRLRRRYFVTPKEHKKIERGRQAVKEHLLEMQRISAMRC